MFIHCTRLHLFANKKRKHCSINPVFLLFSIFLFEKPRQRNCVSEGLQDVLTSGGKKKKNKEPNKRKQYLSSIESTLFILSHSFIILPAQHTLNCHQKQDPYTSWIGILVDYARKRFCFSHHIKWLFTDACTVPGLNSPLSNQRKGFVYTLTRCLVGTFHNLCIRFTNLPKKTFDFNQNLMRYLATLVILSVASSASKTWLSRSKLARLEYEAASTGESRLKEALTLNFKGKRKRQSFVTGEQQAVKESKIPGHTLWFDLRLFDLKSTQHLTPQKHVECLASETVGYCTATPTKKQTKKTLQKANAGGVFTRSLSFTHTHTCTYTFRVKAKSIYSVKWQIYSKKTWSGSESENQ